MTKISAAHRMADELVEALRDVLAVDCDRVTSMVVIPQIEAACKIRADIAMLESALEERSAS